jgi:hypothetical protein
MYDRSTDGNTEGDNILISIDNMFASPRSKNTSLQVKTIHKKLLIIVSIFALESFSFYITQLIRKYMDANGHERL